MKAIVLHHGLFGYNSLDLGPFRVRYWDGISSSMTRAGYPVILTRVHPTGGIARRAGQLKEQILATLQQSPELGTKVLIIAHSMGGLDARFMITHLDMARHVDALVTISTPHRGSPYYDYLLSHLGPLAQSDLPRDLLVDLRGLWDVTVAQCRRFNAEVPDAPGVRYYCVTAACPLDRAPFRHAHEVTSRCQGENDSLVSVQSARWGTELGHWPFHHLHLVNWPLRLLSPGSHEDVRPRYLQLLSLLRTDGVLEPPVAELASA